MLNIWDNNFYWKPPALSWLFEANFNDFCDLSIFKDKKDLINKAIVSVTIPDRETQMESIYYGGIEVPQYTRANNAGTFTIKFNDDNEYNISKILDYMYNKLSYMANYYPESKGTSPEATFPYRCENVKTQTTKAEGSEETSSEIVPCNGDIIIRTYKYSGIEQSSKPEESAFSYQYTFHNCKFIKLDGFELSYESEDTVTRNATFSYTYMEANNFIK